MITFNLLLKALCIYDFGLFHQIELNEHEDISILAATLAWSDSCLCTFEQAIHSYESALYQVVIDSQFLSCGVLLLVGIILVNYVRMMISEFRLT